MATSPDLVPEKLDAWARMKGIRVLGTGDFTHPGWMKELREKLEPSEGLFRLKSGFRIRESSFPPEKEENAVFFILTAEISTIYSRDGKVRKVHHLLFAPDFDAVEKIQARLSRIGSIVSDGRPILGIDSRDLLELMLSVSENVFFVPSHIWTPWFSALGDKSGFGTIEECYGSLAREIHAVETGLSSDPPMNWMCSFLDRYTLISNSDAHSPQKLGREANLFDTELQYQAIISAMKNGLPDRFLGTLEFFPQEGKYHFDGHRKCGLCWDPRRTLEHEGICPQCGKPVTIGVMNRVLRLADRENGSTRPDKAPFLSVIPLQEVVAEILNAPPGSKRVLQKYHALVMKAGSEFNLLVHFAREEVKRIGGEVLAEAIGRMRGGKVTVREGYDGEYGEIRVFRPGELASFGDGSLFGPQGMAKPSSGSSCLSGLAGRDIPDRKSKSPDAASQESMIPGEKIAAEERVSAVERTGSQEGTGAGKGTSAVKRADPQEGTGAGEEPPCILNDEQKKAVTYGRGPLLVLAGPGTGKTRVLAHRIAFLITELHVPPGCILAVTFTNRAAGEMRKRVDSLGIGRRGIRPNEHTASLEEARFHGIGERPAGGRTNGDLYGLIPDWTREREFPEISTFHAFGYSVLKIHAGLAGRKPGFTLADEAERKAIIRHALGSRQTAALAERISRIKQRAEAHPAMEGENDEARPPSEAPAAHGERTEKEEDDFHRYENYLLEHNQFDLDDLVLWPLRIFRANPEVAGAFRKRIRAMLVDEFQDINEAQYALVRCLMPEPHADLCVIGDPNQAIYGFRGSDVRFIEHFARNYRASITGLRTSYRCTNRILKASSAVIRGPGKEAEHGHASLSGSAGQGAGIRAEELSGLSEGVEVHISRYPSDKSEAEGVARTIETMMGGLRFFSMDSAISQGEETSGIQSLSDFAVLCRTHAQMDVLGKALSDHGIPFETVGEEPFFRQYPVSRLLALCKAGIDPGNGSIRLYLKEEGVTEEDLAHVPAPASGTSARLYLGDLAGRFFAGLNEGHASLLNRILAWAESTGESPADFLARAALGRAEDMVDPRAERVTLLTLHAAKGLEYRCVFITGCETGLLPYELHGKPADPDEERRLLYVGMTRAKSHLFLSHSDKRRLFGREWSPGRSPFLDGIENALAVCLQRKGMKKTGTSQLGLF